MKQKSVKTGRKFAGLVLSAALVVGILSTAAALAANSSDVVQKDTVMTAPASLSPSDTAAVTEGMIQYSKDVYSRTDGSQNFSFEHWYDPASKDMRSDLKEYDNDHQLTRYQSTYFINNGNDLVIIQRDADGNPLSGTIMKRSDQSTIFENYAATDFSFEAAKDFYTGSRWTSIGTEQTSDGKTLNKIMSCYQSYISDTTQANMQLIEYIDPDTGLSVKEELYEDSTGQFELFSTDTNEYRYVTDDGTIFKPDNVKLKLVQGPEETIGK